MYCATVILLSYNQEDFIYDAVQSILLQECEPIKCLFIDDASEDRTFEIIKKIVENYSGPHDVTVIQNHTNLGFPGNLNNSINYVTTDLVIYAAGDDISSRHRVNTILNAFKRSHPLLIHSDVNLIDNFGRAIEPFVRSGLNGQNRMQNLRHAATSMSLHIGASAAFDKSLVEKYGPINNYCFEDLIIGFRAALNSGCHYIPEALVDYRLGNGISQKKEKGLTLDKWKKLRLEILNREKNVLQQRLEDIKHHNEFHEIKNIIEKKIVKVQIKLDAHTYSSMKFLIKNFLNIHISVYLLLSEKFRGIKMTNYRFFSLK